MFCAYVLIWVGTLQTFSCWRRTTVWQRRVGSFDVAFLVFLPVQSTPLIQQTFTFLCDRPKCMAAFSVEATRLLVYSSLLKSKRTPGAFWQGQGQGPQLQPCAPPPNILVTGLQQFSTTKHQHIDAKRSVLWPAKYAKMRFRPGSASDPAGGAHNTPMQTLSRLRRGHPTYTLPYSEPTTPRFSRLRHSPLGVSVWGALPPNSFL